MEIFHWKILLEFENHIKVLSNQKLKRRSEKEVLFQIRLAKASLSHRKSLHSEIYKKS